MGPPGVARGPACEQLEARTPAARCDQHRGRLRVSDDGCRADERGDRQRLYPFGRTVIFIDTNVPMYLVGAAHAHKAGAKRLLERAAASGDRLVTDAEAFQEILHRYVAIGRRDAIQPTFTVLYELVDEIFPIDSATVERAKALVLGYPRLTARDAIHVATMQAHDVGRIMSFDTAFDGIPGLVRLAE